ncbi:MAG TPA: methionine--tRNA ligase [Candidatus Eremiobacteraceae bacterium]|nr:methionine--tRNA ligase [Candidatus Eremiobacteraceae bacterium]
MPRYLVTSALPYISDAKHLGNLVGSMLPADVYARFLRLRGEDVLYICATDEHGTPAELAALNAGLEVSEYCRKQHAVLKGLCEGFFLSFDYFGRSSSPQNHELTKHFAAMLERNGLIEERTTQQMFSVAENRFLPDRYVVGTCPHCGYTAARGDQCENCTNLLEPGELIDPRSSVSGSTELEMRETKHLFLRQSLMTDRLRSWIEQHEDWPVLVRSIALKWLDEGIKDRSITRDLKWGIPVDRPGFENKVFYVWFDAPIEYIGSTKELSDAQPAKCDWKSWWYEPKDVRYVQFMAKDNIPFHTVTFPATIMGSGEPWKLVDYVKGFNWLNYYGGKFSTSSRRGVFMADALELLPADYWRYQLMANAPEGADATFTWEIFADTVNKDLADTFGNFVNRVVKLIAMNFESKVPPYGKATPEERDLLDGLREHGAALTSSLGGLQFRKAVQSLKAMWALGNVYLDRTAPWKSIKTDRSAAGHVLAVSVNLIRIFATAALPFIPDTGARTLRALRIDAAASRWLPDDLASELRVAAFGSPVDDPGVLFKKVLPEDAAAWQARFAGSERR